MTNRQIPTAIKILQREIRQWQVPIVGVVARQSRDPFQVLVSCLLSLRTKDETTAGASARLFRLATTPRGILRLPLRTIERVIYPVGFYRTKARTLQAISRDLLARFGGKVPATIEDLLTLKGVGRKTANLVVTLGHDGDGICVDTHVHRITNRWGYVKTKTPEQTEQVLRAQLPRRYWKIFNDLLVTYGQNLCKPISPWCSRCRLASYCDRMGVGRSR